MSRRLLMGTGLGHPQARIRLLLGASVAVGALLLAAPALSAPSLLAWWGDAGSGDGQIGAAATGIAVDAQGDVFVADRAVDRVKRFKNDGTPVTAWGGLQQPVGLAIGPDGTVYVSDRARVRRFTPDGKPLTTWSTDARFDRTDASNPSTGGGRPHGTGGIAVASNGTVYVTDLAEGAVRRLDANGVELEPWIGLNEPRGVAVAPDGSIYVAEDGNNQVRRFSTAGANLGSWAVDDPHGVATAPDGQVYVTDAASHRVLRFDAEGKLQEAFGNTGEGGARLNKPEAVAVDCQGTLYVLDSSEKRVHKFGDPAAAPPPCGTDPIGGEKVTPTPTPTPSPEPTPTPTPTPTPEPVPPPEVGTTTLAEVVEGEVLVDTGKGKPEPLREDALVPIGATVDATKGRARLTFETAADDRPKLGQFQSGEFYGGEFTVHQARSDSLVELRLAGALASRRQSASRESARSAKRKRRSSRRLWGNAKGRFRTTGRYGAATVRGTRWLTEDRADGTLVRVEEGVVSVRELERGRTVTVRAGQKHLARARCASRRNFRITLRAPVGAKVRSARVLVNRRSVRVWRGRRPTARVDLRGLPKGRVSVRITVVTDTGLTLRGTRTYLTCTKARPGRVPTL